MTVENDAYRYAIRNAFDHKGKADMGALVGKLKALYPDSNPKELIPVAKSAVERVNNMGMDEIRVAFEQFSTEGFELKIPDKKVGLLDLDWAANEPVITRFAPNPSAPIHMGHARPAILCYLYSKKYNGKFILRFDDTDPKIKKPMEGGEQLFLDDLTWLGIHPDMVTRSSDRMEIYYDYMHQVVGLGKAYVCTCEVEGWKEKKIRKEACPCRDLSIEENDKRLTMMLNHTYKEGEAVLRIKTDLNAEDPAERDWSAARVVDHPQHYRVQDKHLWPTYNFASAIDDHLMNISLIIRGQQHTSNVKKQEWLYKHFGWTYPHSFHHGLIMMQGAELSKSKILAGIASGKYNGWDDPRLFTIQSLRRKGFNPQTFIDLMIDLGVKTSDTMLDLEVLATFNRKYVQNAPIVPFIQDPVQLDTDFVPATKSNIDGKEHELRAGTQSFFVSKKDAEKWNVGNTLRLRNAYIVKINSKDEYKINAQFVSTAKLENTTQTNWLVEGIDVRITMPDATFIHGIAGGEMASMNVDDVVFFPNFGYCRVDAKTDNEVQLWFTHP